MNNKQILDLTDKLHLDIDGNSIPSMLVSLCKIEVCPSAKDTLNPTDLISIGESAIAQVIHVINHLWETDVTFRQVVVCNLIANTQLDILCDTKKYMN